MPTPCPQPWPVTNSAVLARAAAALVATTAETNTTSRPSLTRNRSTTSGSRQTKSKGRAECTEPHGSFGGAQPRLTRMRRLLVANRGEIALRIFRACRAEGLEAVAVAAPDDLEEARAAARREAAAAFGDETVFYERLLERPRHVEIQLLADRHGNVAALGERDCSIERRHQKVLEEAPSPALDPELRARMSDAAVAFARAIGYESAGTAEFMLDGRDFWFLELNARIQVEHPVTELVTGVDIVREQLRIASGEAMSSQVTDCYLRGHAVEVRLYAEDPRSFLPQAGRLERLRLPDGIRVDSGVRQGDEIGTAYDPMIAKLIASGDTRTEALDRLAQALRETEVGGVTTHLPFLRWPVAHPRVRAGRVTTAFLTENPPLSEPPAATPAEVWSDPWRLNLPSPPSQPAPDVAATAGGPGTSGHERSEVVA